MQTEYKEGIVFKFCRPSGAQAKAPSQTITDALRRLSEADEMQPLLGEARARRRKVVVEVFHSRTGYPILICIKAVPGGRSIDD